MTTEEQTVKTQLVKGLAESAYHGHGALSKSQLDLFLRSPGHYQDRAYAFGGTESAAFREGRMVHCAVLEPEVFAETYIALDFSDRRSKAWKEAEATAKKGGNIAITQTEDAMVVSILLALREHPEASKIFSAGIAEVSAFATDPGTGLAIRGRMDWIVQEGNKLCIYDLKTARDASYWGFRSSVLTYRYHLQAAMYEHLARLNGFDEVEFWFVAIEKKRPFPVGIYRLSPSSTQKGFKLLAESLASFAVCKEQNKWPTYNGNAGTVLELD